MKSSIRPRLTVLGLDGLPYSLAVRLTSSGKFPSLAHLVDSPFTGAIDAELPEISPVNWTSFYTASGPGRHGVFGFTRINPQDYTLNMVNSAAVAGETIFDSLGRAGLVSKVVNLPNTYPARPLRGMLVAGFVAPEMGRAVFPPFLRGALESAGYRLEADTLTGATDHVRLLDDLRVTLAGRRKALELLWPDLAWDLFVFVLTETDRLFHFLLPALTDDCHPMHSACLDFLVEWDRLIGEVLERHESLPEPKKLMVLADHGFTALRTEVDLNAWLAERGLFVSSRPELLSDRNDWSLGLTPEPERMLITPEAAAFALDPGRIYLHTSRRFAQGRLDDAAAARLREDVRQELLGLTFEGEPVLESVHRAEDIYAGPCLPYSPDLICQARPGFDLKAKQTRRKVFGFFGRTGTHTVGDAFFHGDFSPRPSRVHETGLAVLQHFGLRRDEPASLVLSGIHA